MRMLRLTAILLTLCVINASAQQTSESTESSRAESSTALAKYVLQVNRPAGCIVSPISPQHKYGSVVYALPRPARVPRDSSGQPIPSNVQVWATAEGEYWRVRALVGLGEFYDAAEFKVGDFKLKVNELATVPEVGRFGLSPIRVGVMKIERQPLGKPQFLNLTQSVELQSMEVSNLPDPFKLMLKNKSAQDVIAIQYNTFGGGGFLELKWLSPGLLTPLIKAGEVYKLEISSEDTSCGDDDGYRPNQVHRIDFVSAVFADGTYEGEPGLAVLIKGTALGNRRNLARVVEFIASITDPAELAQQLEYLQQQMNEEAEPYLVETLRGMFPTVPTDSDVLLNFVRTGMHEVKTNLMRDAQHLRALSEHKNPVFGKRGVEDTKSKYERWWAAVQNMTSH